MPREGALFYGGLGQASGGIRLDPDLLGIIYPYPLRNVAHGCLLEGIALAMERRFEPFSKGRGLITPQRVEEMWQIAQKHGIGLPPLFNGEGLVEEEMASLRRKVPRMKSAEKGQVEFPELLFGMSWEDPESDRRALRIQPGEVVVTIGSGGCNTFDLLLEDPGRIFAVDINPCQSHLLELKCAAIRRLDLDDLHAFLGLKPV